MPQVPVYGDRQVRTQALQPVFQNAPDVSSGTRALAQGLGQLGEVADRIDLRDAEAKANEVDTQLTREWDKWENENRGKYTNQAADGYAKAVDEWWKEAAKTYGGGLNGRSQAMVGKTLSRRQTIALEQAGKYEFAEKEKYADSTTAAAVTTATVAALKTGDYAGESQRVRDLVEEQGRRKNWDKDQRDAARNAQLGTFHTAVVAQLAEKDAAQAKKYLEDAIGRGEVPADRQTRLETIINGEADNQFATKFAAENANKPYPEQIAAAGQIENPQRREKALTAVKAQQAHIREAQRANEEAVSDKAWQLVGQGQRVPEAILAAMDGRERVQLQEAMRARFTRAATGATVKTDWNTYINLRERLATGENVRIEAYTEKIAPAQLEQLIDIKTRKGPEVASSEQQLSAYTRQMDLKGEALGRFQSSAYDAFNMFAQRTGKTPDHKERLDILDALTRDVVTHKGLLWDSKTPAYKAPADIRRQAVSNQVPPQQPSSPVRVTSIEQARALPKGTRFLDPNGVERIR